MGNAWKMSKMEGKILMTIARPDQILKQWEQANELKQAKAQIEKVMAKLQKPKPKAPPKKKK